MYTYIQGRQPTTSYLCLPLCTKPSPPTPDTITLSPAHCETGPSVQQLLSQQAIQGSQFGTGKRRKPKVKNVRTVPAAAARPRGGAAAGAAGTAPALPPLPDYCTVASGLRFNNSALHSTDPVTLSLQQNRGIQTRGAPSLPARLPPPQHPHPKENK